jgi:hypothetical protein
VGNFIKTIIVIGTVVILISFSLATAMRKNKAIPGYLKYFYLLPLMQFLLSVKSIIYLLKISSAVDKYGLQFEKIIVALDLLFWMFFFTALFKNFRFNKFVKILGLISFSLIILYLINNIKSLDYDLIGFTNIVKCAFCIMYFFSIFSDIPNLDLKKDPKFWIISGLLFCSTVSTPVFLSAGYFRNYSSSYLTYTILAIGNSAIIIMHLLFIKGYLCIIQPRKIL